jgi:hypothetical protein
MIYGYFLQYIHLEKTKTTSSNLERRWLDLPTYPRADLEAAGEYAAETKTSVAPAAGFSRSQKGVREVIFETQISLRAQTEEAEIPVAADPLDDVAGLQVDDLDLIKDTFKAGKQRVAGRVSKGPRRAIYRHDRQTRRSRICDGTSVGRTPSLAMAWGSASIGRLSRAILDAMGRRRRVAEILKLCRCGC